MAEEELTEEQAKEIMREFSEQKQTLHGFFRDVVMTKDTIKTGNLTQDELGMPPINVRAIKELELFCKDVYDDQMFGTYFQKLAEIQAATSLSKDAILLKLSVTQKRELADLTPKDKKKNKGWFSKKDSNEPQQ